jgi:hypothetical protein
MRRTFATRKQGQGMAKRSWICAGCNASYSERPKRCERCGVPDMLGFDSEKELRRYAELLLLQRAKQIKALTVHPSYPLIVRDRSGGETAIGRYEADFSYSENDAIVVEDVKPKDPRAHDPVFVWKRKHFEAQYGIELRIV